MNGRWAVFGAAAAGTFLGALDLNVVPVAFDDITRSFPHATLGALSWVTTGYAVAFGAALLPAGALADRLGRRAVFLIGLSLFTVASACCALAGGVGMLIAARFAQGVGAGTMTPLALALILPAFGPAARGRAIGLWSAVGALAAAAGPAVGGLLVGVDSWRLVFWCTVPLGAVAVVVGWRVLPRVDEGRDGPGRLPDLLGAALLAAAVGAAALGLASGGDWGWTSPATLGTLGAAVALSVGFGLRTARIADPLIRPGLLRLRPVRVANVALLLFGLLYFALQLANALFLTSVWDYTALEAGLALTPGAVVATAASYVGGPAGARYGNRVIAQVSVLLFGAGCLMLALGTGPGTSYVTGFLPGLLVSSVGSSAAFSVLAAAAVESVPASELGIGSALSVTSRAIGASLGFAGLAAVLASPAGGALAGYHRAWWIVAVGTVVTAVAATAIRRPATTA
ncbi:MFS transporter [Longispora sp. NPDC051575]|uniref:MFS transporter n=1 Tax=Longispora sp. NPDC051575 TaxID=3154943 RepID=UPI003440B968